MEACTDQKGDSGFPVSSERYPDPSKSCAYLKQDQQEVENAEEQDDAYSSYIHLRTPS